MALNICLVQEGDQHFTCLAVGFLLGRSRYADRRGPRPNPKGSLRRDQASLCSRCVVMTIKWDCARILSRQ
jgi:hypothetical protein